jgi:adenylate kinase
MVQNHLPNKHAANGTDQVSEEAQAIFREVWAELAQRVESGSASLPKEMIWLGGAPGSGKGTNTPFILRERSITALPIVTSELLDLPEMKRLKDGGNLVGDRDVIRILFTKLLNPEYDGGVLIDGFPRSRVQVECVKLLYKQMLELRAKYCDTPRAGFFPKPIFQIVVLYVEEKESIERQLKRGRQLIAHNARVRETGVGQLMEERATDLNEESCRKRYRVFMEQTYAVLQSLKEVFHYHVINAQGDVGSVERAIIREFAYQSSLELDDETFDALHHIPLASEIVLNARQHLVRRLESYQREQTPLFHRVIDAIEQDFVPVILLHGITGLAKITTENELFANPLAMTMLVDVLNERGYRTTATVEGRDIPTRIDPVTFYIICTKKPRYRFEIRFNGSVIRRGL